MYEPFEETAARVLLAVNPGDSIRTVAQHLHTPYETVRQAVNQLEDRGYLRYDDGLFVTDDRVRGAARDLLVTSAGVNPPSTEEAYVLPQFGDWPFAFTQVDAVYVWTQGGFQVVANPVTIRSFLPSLRRTSTPGNVFSNSLESRQDLSVNRRTRLKALSKSSRRAFSALPRDHVKGYPVISRRETIAFMREH